MQKTKYESCFCATETEMMVGKFTTNQKKMFNQAMTVDFYHFSHALSILWTSEIIFIKC